MADTPKPRRIAPLALLAIALCCAIALLAGSGERAVAGQGCPKADAKPGQATSQQLGDSILCLIGKERRKADVKRVDPVNSLTRVAEKHTKVMIRKDCLDHRCPGEKSLKERIEDSGDPKPGGRYGWGEVTGCSRTPQAMIDKWMDKRFHSNVISGKKYRHVGVGAGKARLDLRRCRDARRGIYTVIFGWRKR